MSENQEVEKTSLIEIKPNEWNEVVVSSAYDKKLVNVLRGIRGAKYDPTNYSWIYPKQKYKELVEKLDQHEFDYNSEVTKEYLSKILLLIHNEDEKTMHISSPFNLQVNQLLKGNNGIFNKPTYKWILPTDKKKSLLSQLNKNKIKIKHLKDKPKSK